jgi:hypothetical protein
MVKGGGGTRGGREKVRKSFVVKILTSKSLGLKILQTFFAKPAPVKSFKGVGGGGTSANPHFSQKGTRSHAVGVTHRENFLGDINSISIPESRRQSFPLTPRPAFCSIV